MLAYMLHKRFARIQSMDGGGRRGGSASAWCLYTGRALEIEVSLPISRTPSAWRMTPPPSRSRSRRRLDAARLNSEDSRFMWYCFCDGRETSVAASKKTKRRASPPTSIRRGHNSIAFKVQRPVCVSITTTKSFWGWIAGQRLFVQCEEHITACSNTPQLRAALVCFLTQEDSG